MHLAAITIIQSCTWEERSLILAACLRLPIDSELKLSTIVRLRLDDRLRGWRWTLATSQPPSPVSTKPDRPRSASRGSGSGGVEASLIEGELRVGIELW